MEKTEIVTQLRQTERITVNHKAKRCKLKAGIQLENADMKFCVGAVLKAVRNRKYQNK